MILKHYNEISENGLIVSLNYVKQFYLKNLIFCLIFLSQSKLKLLIDNMLELVRSNISTCEFE